MRDIDRLQFLMENEYTLISVIGGFRVVSIDEHGNRHYQGGCCSDMRDAIDNAMKVGLRNE